MTTAVVVVVVVKRAMALVKALVSTVEEEVLNGSVEVDWQALSQPHWTTPINGNNSLLVFDPSPTSYCHHCRDPYPHLLLLRHLPDKTGQYDSWEEAFVYNTGMNGVMNRVYGEKPRMRGVVGAVVDSGGRTETLSLLK